MVKGITKQVIVVKSPEPKLFEQAIFLIKDDALSEGGITEEALLREARMVCRGSADGLPWAQRLLWSAFGGIAVGLLWALTAFL